MTRIEFESGVTITTGEIKTEILIQTPLATTVRNLTAKSFGGQCGCLLIPDTPFI